MDTSCRNKALPAAVLALAVALAGPTSAQVVGEVPLNTPQAVVPRSAEPVQRFDMRASSLIGTGVRNMRGHDIGEIQELFVDARNQRVRYAVVAFGGVLGLGEKLFPFPIRAFYHTPGADVLQLDVDVARLEDAPGFERDTWPNYGDPRFFEEVRRYFGEAEEATPAPLMLRGTALMGREVEGMGGDQVGEVQDFVVDMGSGRIPYVVLAADKAWSLDEKLLPLPLSVFGFPNQRDADLVLMVDRSTLRVAEGIDRNAWPDLNAPGFRNRVDQQLAVVERNAQVQSGASGGEAAAGRR